MINLGYKDRGLYTQKYFDRKFTLPSKTDLDLDYTITDLIRDTEKYVKSERIKLKKLLRE